MKPIQWAIFAVMVVLFSAFLYADTEYRKKDPNTATKTVTEDVSRDILLRERSEILVNITEYQKRIDALIVRRDEIDAILDQLK